MSNQFAAPKATSVTVSSGLTRNEIRAALLDKKTTAPKRCPLNLFGIDVELLQPSLKAIMELREMQSTSAQTAQAIIRYVVVPGTDERIFEQADAQDIENWSFGEDMVRLTDALSKLTGLNIEEHKEEIKADPLAGES